MKARATTPFTLFMVLLVIPAPESPAQEWPAGVSVPATGPGGGKMIVGYGFDLSVKDDVAPDELQRLWRVLPLFVRVGVASNVEVIGTWRGGLVARSADGTSHTDWGDPSVFTKITLTDTGATLPVGVMFGFKIPSTRYLPHRLGSDATDLSFHLLASRAFGRAELRVNGGAAIVGDPRHAGSQDDLLTGSAMFIVRTEEAWMVFGELVGFSGPKEDDDKLQFRGGAGFDAGIGSVTLYGNARLAGSTIDFGTAFEATGSWGLGVSLSHLVSF